MVNLKREFPKVSIVVPSFNQGQFIEATLRSIIEQDYPNIEILVIDGGSTDMSIGIINKYQEHLYYWISEPDNGQADAINKGWLKSTGEYICWLNSDDLLLPHSISTTVNLLESNSKFSFVYGNLINIDSNGNNLGETHYQDYDFEKLVRNASYFSQPGSLFRRSLLSDIGYLDSNYHFLIDFDYWTRVGCKHSGFHINTNLAAFRIHDSSKTVSKLDVAAKEIIHIYSKLYSRSDLPTNIRILKDEAFGNAYLYSSTRLLSSYYFNESFQNLMIAKNQYPNIMLHPRFIKNFLILCIAKIIGCKRFTTIYSYIKKSKFRFINY